VIRHPAERARADAARADGEAHDEAGGHAGVARQVGLTQHHRHREGGNEHEAEEAQQHEGEHPAGDEQERERERGREQEDADHRAAHPHAVGHRSRRERADRARAQEHREQGADEARVAVQHVLPVEGHERGEAELGPRADRHHQDEEAHGAHHGAGARRVGAGSGDGGRRRGEAREHRGEKARHQQAGHEHAQAPRGAEADEERGEQRRAQRDAHVAAGGEDRDAGGLAVARHRGGGAIAFRVIRGHPEAGDHHQGQHRGVGGREAEEGEPERGEQHRQRQQPAPGRLVREVAEEGLDQRRGDVRGEHDHPGRGVGQIERVLQHRQDRGQRALIDVDDHVPEGQ
jgi:hypothetical protein